MDSSSGATGFLLFGTTAYLFLYARLVARPVCRSGNKTMQKLLDQCPSLSQLYWPPPHCWNPHTQFIPFVVRGELNKLYPRFKWYREEIVLPDGELLALDWVISTPGMEQNGLTEDALNSTPILMLHHGAMCDSTDMPGQDYIAPALQRGWLVCVLNRRGHGDLLRRPKWNFFGCVQDVRCVTQSIKDRRPKAKLLTVGLSSGTANVATIFGHDDDVNHFHAGVLICPGYCIEKCMARFTSPYMEFLLWRGKEFFLKANKALLEHIPGYHECLNAPNLHEWLRTAHAMAGCSSVEDYYSRYNPVNFVGRATRPLLSINSENDPLCVVQNYHEEVTKLMRRECCIGSVLTKTGSHCPFYEGISMGNWAEKVTFEFFDAFLLSEQRKESPAAI